MRAPLLLSFALLAGCASTSPDVVCTGQWIAPRVDRAVDRVESDAGRVLDNLVKVGRAWVAGDEPGMLTMLSLKRSIDRLEDELRDGRGVRDLRTLARTCDDPDILVDGMTDFLARRNMPEPLRAFITGTDGWRDILELYRDD